MNDAYEGTGAGDAEPPRAIPPGEHAAASPPPPRRWKEAPGDDDDQGEVSLGAGRDRDPVEMDMTPMVDVTFLLLIFFMVTASFTLLKAIQQPPPTTEDPSTQQVEEPEDNPDQIVVFIDELNTFTVIYGEIEAEAPSEQELYVQLHQAMNSGPIAPTKLLVKAHGDSSHERVVMAMDAGTEIGLSQVQVQLTEEDAL